MNSGGSGAISGIMSGIDILVKCGRDMQVPMSIVGWKRPSFSFRSMWLPVRSGSSCQDPTLSETAHGRARGRATQSLGRIGAQDQDIRPGKLGSNG